MKQSPVNFFLKTSKELQIDILSKALQGFHSQNIEADSNVAKQLHECLFDAIVDTQNILFCKGKAKNINLDMIAKRDALAKKSIKITRTKAKPKTNKLRFYKLEIIKLKKEGMSFREIEKYLAREHKFKIDYSTIAKEYKKWKMN